MMDWVMAVAKAVADGKTDSQFAIPDGKYIGDLFFITDEKNQILIGFSWTGSRWMHEFETVFVEVNARDTEIKPPSGFKPITK